MTPIEIIATVLAVFILVKILVILISFESWLKIAEPLLKKRALATIIYSLLAIIVGYYVFCKPECCTDSFCDAIHIAFNSDRFDSLFERTAEDSKRRFGNRT